MDENLPTKWIFQDTAILVVHGIGNQKPIETLDQFARTLIETFEEESLELSHKVAQKPRSGKGFWYDNFVRIEHEDSDSHLDIYEYYWANLTEGLATVEDINHWIRGVVRGAKKFYRRNTFLLQEENESFFKKGGNIWLFRYWMFLKISGRLIPIIQKSIRLLCFLFSKVPVIGWVVVPVLDWLKKLMKQNVENIIGDIIVYNSLDAKSKFYEVRKAILDGAVSALRYLIEPNAYAPDTFRYGRVVVAGHSLGSQISFDAINRLTHHMSGGNVRGYDENGHIRNRMEAPEGCETAADILSGLDYLRKSA